MNSFYITRHEDFMKDYNKGLYVDVFEVVPFPNINIGLQKWIVLWLSKIDFFYSVKQDVSLKNHIAALVFPVIRASLNLIWSIINLGPKTKLGYEKHFSVYGNSYPKDVIFPLKDIAFEGKIFKGPANTDRYLTSIYGDYMKLPPEDKRRTHIIYVDFR